MFRNILVQAFFYNGTGEGGNLGIGGVAGLTKKSIRKYLGHYGRAIRDNVGDAVKMKKAVMAMWKHRSRAHSHCGN